MSLRENAEGDVQPIVLLATAERWTSTARLALALRRLGCEIVLLAPGGHPAAISGAVSRRFRYDPLRPLPSLRRALRSAPFATVLPADETVACQFGELWAELKRAGKKEPSPEHEAFGALLTRSLGAPERLCESSARMLLQRAAEAEAIPTPATMEILSESDLPAAFEQLGSSLVLKADGTSGGRGVRTVSSLRAAQRIFRSFSVAPHLPRAVLRGVLHRDWTHLLPAARRERRGVTAQKLVTGVERNAIVMAKHGEVLALECFEVVHTWKLRGPSSVLRRVHDPRMESAIRALVRRLDITGFSGFDFIVDAATGEPLLLERNARPTQVAHLSFGAGHDLAAAYVRAIVGRHDVRDRVAATARDSVALFPQELQRDRASAALHEAFHDVPWEAPALVKHALRGDAALRAALGEERRPTTHRSQESGSFQVAR